MTLIADLCVVFGAAAIGFVFAAVFYRSGSLIPCIITHSLYDAFSAFANEAAITDGFRIVINAVQFIVLMLYGIYILKSGGTGKECSNH